MNKLKAVTEQVRGLGYLPQDTDATAKSAVDAIDENKEMFVIFLEEKQEGQSTPKTSAFVNRPFETADAAWTQLRQFGINSFNKLKAANKNLKYEIKQSAATGDRANAFILVYGYKDDKIPNTVKEAVYYYKLYMKKTKYYNAGKQGRNAVTGIAANGKPIVDTYILPDKTRTTPPESITVNDIDTAKTRIKDVMRSSKDYYSGASVLEMAKDQTKDKGLAQAVFIPNRQMPVAISMVRGTELQSDFAWLTANADKAAPANKQAIPPKKK